MYPQTETQKYSLTDPLVVSSPRFSERKETCRKKRNMQKEDFETHPKVFEISKSDQKSLRPMIFYISGKLLIRPLSGHENVVLIKGGHIIEVAK